MEDVHGLKKPTLCDETQDVECLGLFRCCLLPMADSPDHITVRIPGISLKVQKFALSQTCFGNKYKGEGSIDKRKP